MFYVVDVELIYDGSAGKILSVSILPQNASTGQSKVAHITDQYSLAAISTDKATFILATEPEGKILHRWWKPGKEYYSVCGIKEYLSRYNSI